MDKHNERYSIKFDIDENSRVIHFYNEYLTLRRFKRIFGYSFIFGFLFFLLLSVVDYTMVYRLPFMAILALVWLILNYVDKRQTSLIDELSNIKPEPHKDFYVFKNKKGDLIKFKIKSACGYNGCKGIVYSFEPPENEANHINMLGKCDVNNRHMYEIDKNWQGFKREFNLTCFG